MPEGAQDRLLRSGRVFEYWAHEASLIPVADWPYFVGAHAGSAPSPLVRAGARPARRTSCARILATAAEQGPVSSRNFGGAGTGYWNWTEAKRALDALWTAGQLVVAGRKGVERLYDLPERVLPPAVLDAPVADACRAPALPADAHACARAGWCTRSALATTTA